MLKKEIKAIFKAIRNRDLELTKKLIAEKPELIFVCNFAPPKKDDGQSTLQVAFKTGNFEIAMFLIDKGADVNFIEKSEINEWNAPVMHDCIRATIFSILPITEEDDYFDKGMSCLNKLLEKGGNPKSIDSYGNNCLHRAILDARQIIIGHNDECKKGIVIPKLQKVFSTLLSAGADPNEGNERRPSAKETIKNFGLEHYNLL